jgi:hypothetical protein
MSGRKDIEIKTRQQPKPVALLKQNTDADSTSQLPLISSRSMVSDDATTVAVNERKSIIAVEKSKLSSSPSHKMLVPHTVEVLQPNTNNVATI